MHARTDTTERILLAALFVLLVLITLPLSGCQTASETVTTTTSPDGVVTQTVRRPVVDPFDIAFSDAARDFFKEGQQ